MKKLYKSKEWQVSYDPECDEMFVGVLPQPKATSIYVDGVHYHIMGNGQICGFFVEYFKTQLREGLKMLKNK